MAQAETVTVSPDTDVAGTLLRFNESLLRYAESPWFTKVGRAVGRVVVGGGTTWGIPTTDGAIIYAGRRWDEYAPPVGLEGADRLRLSLQRPGEITENWLTDGVQYVLCPQSSDGRGKLLLDGYEKEQVKDEVLQWAGVDSPTALVAHISDAIHHGRIYSATHRNWATYSAITSQGDVAALYGSKEATVKQGRSLTNRTLEISLDKSDQKIRGGRHMLVYGNIAQTDPPECHLTELQVFGTLFGIESHDDVSSQPTTDQLAYAQYVGDALLQHCADSIDAAAQRASELPTAVSTD